MRAVEDCHDGGVKVRRIEDSGYKTLPWRGSGLAAIDLSRITVLFGPNGAGKSNALEYIGWCFEDAPTHAEWPKQRPGGRDVSVARDEFPGSLAIQLDRWREQDVERDVFWRVLTDPATADEFFYWPTDRVVRKRASEEKSVLLADAHRAFPSPCGGTADIVRMIDLWSDVLAEGDDRAFFEDRCLLARSLFEQAVVSTGVSVRLLFVASELSNQARVAAQRIAEAGSEWDHDPILRAAIHAVQEPRDDEPYEFTDSNADARPIPELSELFANVWRVDAAEGRLLADLEQVVVTASDPMALARLANELAPSFVSEQGAIVIATPRELRADDDCEAAIVDLVLSRIAAEDPARATVLRSDGRWTHGTPNLLAEVPSALRELVAAEYEAAGLIVPPKFGGPVEAAGASFAGVWFRETGEGARLVPVGDLGDGIKRWVAISVLAAARRIRSPDLFGLYLIDEPEAHLHPNAIRSLTRWLVERNREGIGVVVATHALELLDLPTELAEFLLVTRQGEESRFTSVTGSLIPALEEQSAAAGIGRGDALRLARGVLIVEGIHDDLVIRHFYGAELDRARVLMLPLEGVNEAKALLELRYLAMLDRPLVALFDSIRANFREKPREEWAKEETVASELGIPVCSHGLPDIICALPEDAVRKIVPGFTDWSSVVAAYKGTVAKSNFKTFFGEQFRLEPPRRRWVERVLHRCGPDDRPDLTLERAMQETLARFVEESARG